MPSVVVLYVKKILLGSTKIFELEEWCGLIKR